MLNSQRRPEARQSKVTLPFSCPWMLELMSLVPKPCVAGRVDGGTPALQPLQPQRLRAELPLDADAAGRLRQRAILGGVGCELVQGERKRLRHRRLKHDGRTQGHNRGRRHGFGTAPAPRRPDGRDLRPPNANEREARAPATGPDAPFDGGDVARHVIRSRQVQDRLDDGERVLRSMVNLARQDRLPIERRRQLNSPFRHTPLELGVQPLELLRLSIKVDEDPNLRAQDIRNNRHRHVVDRALGVTPHRVDLGKVNCRHEDDRRLLDNGDAHGSSRRARSHQDPAC